MNKIIPKIIVAICPIIIIGIILILLPQTKNVMGGSSVSNPNFWKLINNYIQPISSSWGIGNNNTNSIFKTSTSTELCLSGDNCIIAWPEGDYEVDPVWTATSSNYLTKYEASSTYEPLLPATPENPLTKFLNGNREWTTVSIGGGGYAANVYFTTQDSDVSGYKKLSYTNETSPTTLSGSITNQEVLFRTYLYDTGIDTTVIPAGVWVANYQVKVSNAVQTTQLKFEAFLRHTDNTETTLFSTYSSEIDNTDFEVIRNDSNQSAFSTDPTDRFGVRIYAKTTSPTSVTISTIVGGTEPSYFNLPLALRHTQLRDLNGDDLYLHTTSGQQIYWDAKEQPLTFNYPLLRTDDVISIVPTSSLNLTTSSFESGNISQWVNDVGYVTSTADAEVDPIWTAASSTYLTTTTAAMLYQPIGSYLTSESDPVFSAVSTTLLYNNTNFGGDVSGTYDNLQVTDDSHNHTSTTISDLTTADFASNNISQWNNDAGYVTSTADAETDPIFMAASTSLNYVVEETDPIWTAASTTVGFLAKENIWTGLVNTFQTIYASVVSSTVGFFNTLNATSTQTIDLNVTGNTTSTNTYTSNLAIATLTGILKATGGVVSTATAGVDYVASESDPIFMAASTTLNYVVTESDPVYMATSNTLPYLSVETDPIYSAASTTFVLRNDWTTHDNYPAACSAGQYVSAIGDTLTCSEPTTGGTNDWGRFGETYGEMCLMTSSTSPVWLDDSLYASSSVKITGSDAYLDVGGDGNGIASLFVTATSTDSLPLLLQNSAGGTGNDDDQAFSVIDSSGEEFFNLATTTIPGLVNQAAALTMGSENHKGLIVFRGGATTGGGAIAMYNNTNDSIQTTYSRSGWDVSNTGQSVTSSLTSQTFKLFKQDGNLDGTFGVTGVGNVSASGSLSLYGDLSKIRGVDYVWPSSQSSYNRYLKNDGYGNLSWASVTMTESDPIWGAASTSLTVDNFASDDISQWNNDVGYLTEETDPVFMAASTSLPYLTSFTESDPIWSAVSTSLATSNFASGNVSQWINDAGYLTAYNETDPVFMAASTSLPYLTSYNETDPIWGAASTSLTVANFTSANVSQWTNDAGYLTTYNETDPVWTGVASQYLKTADFGVPFYNYFHATTTDALTEGSTNFYLNQTRFDNFLSATSSIDSITSLYHLQTAGMQTSPWYISSSGDFLTDGTIFVTNGNFTIHKSGFGDLLDINQSSKTSTGLGTWDFTAADFRIPVTSTLYLRSAGQIGIDTTSNHLMYYGTTTSTIPNYQTLSFTYLFNVWSGTSTLPIGVAIENETFHSILCYTDVGTVTTVITDGTNATNYFTASTTVGTVNLTTNNTFTAGEKRYILMGNTVSTPNKISCTIKKTVDPN